MTGAAMNDLPAAERRDAVLREALDQYVTNCQDHLDQTDETCADERAKLAIAVTLLDELNAAWLGRLGVAV